MVVADKTDFRKLDVCEEGSDKQGQDTRTGDVYTAEVDIQQHTADNLEAA